MRIQTSSSGLILSDSKIDYNLPLLRAHLDSVRNEIIKMSLFIEVGGLIMGVGVG